MAKRKKKTASLRAPADQKRILERPPRTVRQVVYRALEDYETTGEFVADSVKRLSGKAGLDSRDRGLAREIAAGVVRRQSTLDAVIAAHVTRPRENVEPPLWRLLQMGVYELVFLDQIPPHASVNETTELARYLRRPRWTGFLNGALRAVSRSLLEQEVAEPGIDAIPIQNGRYRKSARPCFPDPNDQPGEYFAAAFSFPLWLVERWQAQFEDANALADLGFWFNTPPALSLRVNRLKANRDDMLAAFLQKNISARAGELPDSIQLEESQNVADLPGFAEGKFSVQDETAIQVVELFAPQPGEAIWDFCAAPGTKTMAIAERMQNQGRILATDVSGHRLELIEENRERLGVGIVETQRISRDGADLPSGPFDAVLVDAPCSNTGVLGKRPEARWRLRAEDFSELAEIQLGLLDSACQRIKPGGRLVYSTCSIDAEENKRVVKNFLSHRPDWNLVSEENHWPGRPADGGYAGVLKRQAQ